MAIYRFQVQIPYFTNIPGDVITNDFHFSFLVGNPLDADYLTCANNIVAFYNTIYGDITFGDCMAPWVVPASTYLKVYNVNDPTPRAPRYETVMPLADNRMTDSGIPTEVAVCASFQGDPVSGEPQARRRGRVFIGGLGQVCDPGDADEFPNVHPDLRDAICAAMDGLQQASGPDGWQWVVYSRVNNTGAPITNGWVDNAPDTQRRRGQGSTARSVWP